MTDDARARVNDLFQSMWTLAALTVAAERGLLDGLKAGSSLDALARQGGLQSATVRANFEVLAAAGLVEEVNNEFSVTPSFAAMLEAGSELLRADLLSTLGQLGEIVVAARDPEAPLEGWRAVDPAIVEAQAIVSEGVSRQLAAFMSNLPGLSDRLQQQGAAILDVGAGGAGACIALARHFPTARIVGLEPVPGALAIGRRRVAEADLSDRIELRADAMGDLADEAVFDFAYVAQMFMSQAILETGLPAVRRALRSGGWLVTAATCVRGTTLAAAVSRFRSATWGSAPDRFVEDVIKLLEHADFIDVSIPGKPPGATLVPVVARVA